jgi:flagellar protein FliO/FliZ
MEKKMDNLDLTRFIFAFAFVLGLIGLMSFLLKRYGGASKWMGVQQDTDRLKVLQTRYIDPKRKLILIRRDDVEHLLLISEGRELVIESIKSGKSIEDVHA